MLEAIPLTRISRAQVLFMNFSSRENELTSGSDPSLIPDRGFGLWSGWPVRFWTSSCRNSRRNRGGKAQKTRMMSLPKCKNCDDVSIRLDTVTALVRHTDGRTDGRTDWRTYGFPKTISRSACIACWRGIKLDVLKTVFATC